VIKRNEKKDINEMHIKYRHYEEKTWVWVLHILGSADVVTAVSARWRGLKFG
jgi:ABC-type iron transport system FetAB ATPase subunit